MNTLSPSEIKKILFDSIDSLSNYRDKYLSNSKTSFSRTQKITFRDSMLFPMVIANESTPLEILDFFPVDNLPSPSAMVYRRNQIKKSTILTTNMNFNEWDSIFFDAVVANAIMDRVLHHAKVITISGRSYRLKDHIQSKD